jgi:GNAT superfamily N-acetyltransferase
MATDAVQSVPISAAEVEFHEATPTQCTETWRLNGLSWAAPLALDDYILREQHLGQTSFTANGLNRYWVLTKTVEAGEVVASCETTQKTVLCSGAGGYREVRAYAIASVYTNPKYRRHGMAALLLSRLKEWMDGDGSGEFSALYSDIGKVCVPSFKENAQTGRITTRNSAGPSFRLIKSPSPSLARLACPPLVPNL